MSEVQHLEPRERKGSEALCGEWFRSDRGDAIGWGASLIWGGLVLIAEITNYKANFAWWNAWGAFFTGAGVITLLVALGRLLITSQRAKSVGGLILGCFLLAIGLGEVAAWLWPTLLIAIGAVILMSAFRGRHSEA